MRHVVFRVASERFALPLAAVREVVLPQPPFARVPRSSDAVRGVMNLHGRVVAVVDLAALMGLALQRLEPAAGHVLILDHGKRALGFLIGGVLGVEPLAPPEGGPQGVVRGVAATSAGAVTVLGAEALAGEAARLFGGR
ncbi:MAG TPA: chemotaxis protein CheW [Anaeromyxobacter sp.]